MRAWEADLHPVVRRAAVRARLDALVVDRAELVEPALGDVRHVP